MNRIAIVNDVQLATEALRRVVVSLPDAEVAWIAENGQQAVEKCRADTPDLVLMDLNLPDIDGWEVTRRLKADPLIANIPVIALTAHAMSGDREKALASGCDEFDTKPVEFDRLLRKMNVLLGGST